MAEWMENVEKAIARIMADKVYTSAEFKRERDNFHALCKDLERSEVKKWLAQILEILMAERASSQREEEGGKLDLLIKKHESKALHTKVHSFDKACLDHLKLLEAANAASQKMTSHETADNEVAALRERYAKVKAVSDEWVKKVDVLLKEWTLLDNTVTELNTWVAKD